MTRLRFDRGTVCVEDDRAADRLPGVMWDPRSFAFRAPAYEAPAIVAHLQANGKTTESVPWPTNRIDSGHWSGAPREGGKEWLRPYQQGSLDAWVAAGMRGLVVVPTGGGKTRIALAAMATLQLPTVILCPTRALLEQWRSEIRKVYGGKVGVIGDGARHVEDVTVMTFESAYRHMDTFGSHFALLVVDEAHHFASGARVEALEMSTAPYRLGLTATAPTVDGGSLGPLEHLVGRIVSEVALGELLGTHLAALEMVRISVSLTPEERAEYERHLSSFEAMARAFRRTSPFGDWAALAAALSATEQGREALRGFMRARAMCSLPMAKREMTLRLLARHSEDKALVFTQQVEDAYRIGHDALVPVLSAETARDERDAILAGFRTGKTRVLVSARVLNEGLDVPDARVAILVGGALGTRELVQRVGRVLRAAPGKHALVYELVTEGSLDERRSQRKRAHLAAAFPALA